MKNIIIICFMLLCSDLYAQTAGRIIYHYESAYEDVYDTLFFDKVHSLYVRGGGLSDKVVENKALSKTIMVYQYARLYTNTASKQVIKQKIIGKNKYVCTTLDLNLLPWEIDKTKTKQLLGHTCYKATAGNIYTAWYVPNVFSLAPPSTAGLPGIVLEIKHNDGGGTYTATSLTYEDSIKDADLVIKEGKFVSYEKYEKTKSETEKWLDKMDKMTSQELGIDPDDN